MNNKIKIAVNARFLIADKLEGIGTYSHQVLQHLVKAMPEVEFHFLFDRPWSEKFIYAPNVIPYQIGLPARHPILWYIWFEWSVKKWLDKHKVDLFLSLDSFLSLSVNTPTLLVMHDLAYEHFPKHNPYLVEKYYKYYFPRYARKAVKIFAVSQFTKQDIVQKYNITPNKIEIAYCGVSSLYKPIKIKEKKQIQHAISEGKPYFICIGSLNPRKNIGKAIYAYENYRKNQDYNFNDKLIIVGAKAWKNNQLFKQIKNSPFAKDIILLGHQQPSDLANYLAAAEALIFPSLFEGFGIPIIEAYQCQTPVITSNVSSMLEIGQDAAFLINPNNATEIKDAMIAVKLNSALKELHITNGLKKVAQYQWSKTAAVFQENILLEIEKMKIK